VSEDSKLWKAWKESTGEERRDFLVDICVRFRGLVVRICDKVKREYERKEK
jgi:hypothetical protein